tara:strand:- start:47 stop:1051 length:1005 start_codon:yes stop_codon:yes gene_type:complete
VKLNHLDLFSGIGGFSLGLERTGGFRTIGFCETDAYCTKVLQKNFPGIPIHGDIKKLKGTDFGAVDIITGGYPCQPFSVAGKQKGVEDKRHLWPEYFRIIKESRPAWVIGENVAGHLKLGLDSVLKDLESEGYSARTFSISASSIGANHQRERIWIVAHSECNEHQHTLKKVNGKEKEVQGKHWKENGSARKSVGADPIRETDNTDVADAVEGDAQARRERQREIRKGHQEEGFSGDAACGSKAMADSNSGSEETLNQERVLEEQNTQGETERYPDGSLQIHGQWSTEPNVGRVAHGIPNRVDRLKSLGNSLIPHIPYYIGQSIIATYEDNDTV